jgi:hypothetical protein
VCAYVMSGCSGSLSTPATPTHHTTPHMLVTNRWRQLVERVTRLVRLWPLKRRPGIALGGNQRRYRIRVWHIRCFPRCKYPQGQTREEYSLDLGSSSCSIGSQDFPYAMGRLRVIATRNSAHGRRSLEEHDGAPISTSKAGKMHPNTLKPLPSGCAAGRSTGVCPPPRSTGSWGAG